MLALRIRGGRHCGNVLPLCTISTKGMVPSNMIGIRAVSATTASSLSGPCLCSVQPTRPAATPRRLTSSLSNGGSPISDGNSASLRVEENKGVLTRSLVSPWGQVGEHAPLATTTSRDSVFTRRHRRQDQQQENPPTQRYTLELQQQQQRLEERAQLTGLPPPPPSTGKGGRGKLMLFPESDSHRFVLHVKDLTKQGNLAGVLAALTIAERRPEGVDVRGYRACIDGMAKVRRWGDALELLSRMRAAGVAPDSRCYASAIEACCRSRQHRHASVLRREMASLGVQATPSCFRLELEHVGNSGRWRSALNLLSELKTVGLTPDAKMYNSVLDAFARSSEWQRAAEVMREMEREGHELHARSYRGVVVAASNAGDWRAAWGFFKRMVSRGVQKSSRSPVIFSSVTVTCGAAGRWEEALETLRLTTQQGMAPTRIAYNATLGALGKAGEWRQAQRLLDEMGRSSERSRPSTAPDVYSYTSVIDAFAKAGELEHALRVRGDMRRARVRPSAVTLNALASACRPGGQWRRALSIVEEMRREGIEPDNHTLTLIVAVCDVGGEWKEVISSLREGVAAGDVFLVRVAIAAHARAGNWRAGLEVVRVMRASGVPRDVTVYNALIESLVVRPLSRV